MSVSSNRIAGLVLGGLVALSAAIAPAMAAGITAPTDPDWARWLGLESGTQFVLGKGVSQVKIGDFPEPRRVRVCVAQHTTPEFLNVGARVMADGRQIVVPVAHCGEITGKQITAEAAEALGGKRRVQGIYRIVS